MTSCYLASSRTVALQVHLRPEYPVGIDRSEDVKAMLCVYRRGGFGRIAVIGLELDHADLGRQEMLGMLLVMSEGSPCVLRYR